MNNKIRELATQAVEYCIETYKDSDGPTPWVWEEKFAQLIIAECCEVIIKTDSQFIMREPYRALLDGIRQHFYGDNMTDEISIDTNEELDYYIGKNWWEVDVDLFDKGIKSRIWTKNSVHSTDYDSNRVNIHIDDNGIVTGATYG